MHTDFVDKSILKKPGTHQTSASSDVPCLKIFSMEKNYIATRSDVRADSGVVLEDDTQLQA